MLHLYFRGDMLQFHHVIPRIRNNCVKEPGTQYVFQKVSSRETLANIKSGLTYLSLFNAALFVHPCAQG